MENLEYHLTKTFVRQWIWKFVVKQRFIARRTSVVSQYPIEYLLDLLTCAKYETCADEKQRKT